MKQIKLTQGKFAMVDDSDFLFLSRFKWQAWKDSQSWRVGRHGYVGGTRGPILMSRLIMGFPRGEVDHKDGNPLNNTRSNLRNATRGQNQWNRGVQKRKKHSRFKGVSHSGYNWTAYISQFGVRTHLGSFPDEESAARTYNEEATKRFGERARLNPV